MHGSIEKRGNKQFEKQAIDPAQEAAGFLMKAATDLVIDDNTVKPEVKENMFTLCVLAYAEIGKNDNEQSANKLNRIADGAVRLAAVNYAGPETADEVSSNRSTTHNWNERISAAAQWVEEFDNDNSINRSRHSIYPWNISNRHEAPLSTGPVSETYLDLVRRISSTQALDIFYEG